MVGLYNWLSEVVENKVKPYLAEKEIIQNKNDGDLYSPDISDFMNNDLAGDIERARKQWLRARKYFHSVSDPELVDHASYRIQAARTKYMYLLNKARRDEEGKGINE